MSAVWTEFLVATFLIFCRIGACLMVIPGYGSTRIPPQIKLFVALGITLALAPLLTPVLRSALPDLRSSTVVIFILTEMLIGVSIGFVGRAFFGALQTIGTLAAMSIGITSLPGTAVTEQEPLPALASLMTLTATAMLFITGQHWEIISALVGSYSAIPPIGEFSAQAGLVQVTDGLKEAFLIGLRIGSPFVVYAVLVNLAIGLANKLTPQIPVFFIAMPFVIAGGLFLTMFVISEMLQIFVDAFAFWLREG